MKVIYRYMLRELFLTFILGLLALNFVLMTEQVLSLTKVLATVGASLMDLGRLTLLMQPQITVLTTPMAFLVAILLTYGRLNADSELVVLKASGMPFRDIARPVFMLGVGSFIGCALLSFYVAPIGAGKLKSLVAQIIASRAHNAIEEGIFNTTFRNVTVYVKDKPEADRLKEIFIYDERNPQRPVVMFAAEGGISSAGGFDISFDLKDGHIYIAQEDTTTDISFGRYVLSVPITIKTPARKYDEMTPAELLGSAGGLEGKNRTKMLLEFHRRLSLPAVCLILMFLGPPLALKAGKTGRMGGLSLGLAVFAAYYAALVYSENVARTGRIPHYAGAWLPALALGAFSVWMFRRAEAR